MIISILTIDIDNIINRVPLYCTDIETRALERERERLPRAIRYYNQFTLRPPNSISLASTPINEFRSRLNASDEVRGHKEHSSPPEIDNFRFGEAKWAAVSKGRDSMGWTSRLSSGRKRNKRRKGVYIWVRLLEVIAIWSIREFLDTLMAVKHYYSDFLVIEN